MADAPRRNWTEDELVLALALYVRTPYGRICSSNPDIVQLASYLGRSVGGVAFKLANLAACDPEVLRSGRKGFSNGTKLDKVIWDRYVGDGEISLKNLTRKAWDIMSHMDLDKKILYGEEITNVDVDMVRRESLERLNQSYFRQAIISRYHGMCLISGLTHNSVIEAAHIIPWAEDEKLRLVPSNGLALNPFFHKAYDENLLGIDPDFRVHISSALMLSAQTETTQQYLRQIEGMHLLLDGLAKPNQEYLDRRFEEFRHSHYI